MHDGDEVAVGDRVLVVGFVNSIGLAEFADESTPVPQKQARRPAHKTLLGLCPQVDPKVAPKVELGERCPRCRERVPMPATLCLSCGFEWRKGSKRAPTRDERRVSSSQRRHKRFPVSLSTRFASERWEGQGQILNLSSRGAFVATPRAESVGTECQLEVRSDKGTITLGGFVRHAIHKGDKGMGIEFTDLSNDAHQWIEKQLPVC
jgi:hypothetical protein